MKAYLLSLALLMAPAGAVAQTVTLPIANLPVQVEGVSLSLPASVVLTAPAPGGPARVAMQVDLSPLEERIDPLVEAAIKRAKLDRDGMVAHRGTKLKVEDDRLQARVRIRLKPPVVPASDGAVIIQFRLRNENGKLGVTARVTDFNVQDDITRTAIQALNIDDRIRKEIAEVLNEALEKQGVQLLPPDAARTFGLKMTGQRFATVDGRPVALIEGQVGLPR
jgi:hypothetical protein